ncbi:alpha/beta fold hydrolase [Sphingomonas elodea]|uniref:alpha/beta fold hydrolase n=1 Tax=Sphingomonas elodea TaxID=179878 RepID=UPI001389E82F|nr:hypothetical protein [Sphingomonas elodea]
MVHRIDVPTLVISGALDRIDTPARLEAELLPRIPHATVRILPDTGHLSPLEAPEALATLIAGFVDHLHGFPETCPRAAVAGVLVAQACCVDPAKHLCATHSQGPGEIPGGYSGRLPAGQQHAPILSALLGAACPVVDFQ